MSSRKAAGSKRNRKYRFVPSRSSDHDQRVANELHANNLSVPNLKVQRNLDYRSMPNHRQRTVNIDLFAVKTAAASTTRASFYDPTAHTRINRVIRSLVWKDQGK